MKYELTITLKPMLYRYTANEQFEIVNPILEEILKPFKCTAVVELTGENNLHYHCMVDLVDDKHRDKLLNKLRHKYFGRKSCTQVINEPLWTNYIMKDVDATGRVLKHTIIVKDDFLLRKSLFQVYPPSPGKITSSKDYICQQDGTFVERKPIVRNVGIKGIR